MWSSPISYEAKEFAVIIRESLEILNYVFVRDSTSKTYSRFVVIIPMMGGAHVYRYTVEYPSSFVIQIYDTHPGTKAGLMPFIEINSIVEENRRDVKRLLDEVVSRFQRPPWEFTSGQRLMVGYLLPEFRAARKAWAQLGYDTSRKASRKRRKEEKAKWKLERTGREEEDVKVKEIKGEKKREPAKELSGPDGKGKGPNEKDL
ncbi:MAG: hypothetical protein KAU14_04760 [Thermoplasmata archaeon]|nr:hypothetical protein [Thermoplasmata archaeon]